MRTVLFLSFVSLFLMLACATRKRAPYILPDAMLPHVKLEYAKLCDKGYALYEMACAKCHSTKKWGKEYIPDFSEGQLRGYALRVANTKHETNLSDSLVSEEDLGTIMIFLKYKKKQNKPFTPGLNTVNQGTGPKTE
jgi:hypothetical protein